MCKE